MKKVEIFTDGSCIGNPGPGGWAAILRFGNNELVISGSDMETTNNRMELKAALEALKRLREPCKVILYTDSQYLSKGVTNWMHEWRRTEYKTKSGKIRKNHDLWIALDDQTRIHDIDCRWIRGHDGHVENEEVDKLAREAITACQNDKTPANFRRRKT